MLLDGLDVIFEGFQFRVTDLCHLSIVALTLSALGLILQVLDLLFVLLDLVHQLAFTFPLGTELGFLFSEFGDVLVQLGYFRLIAFSLDRLALDLKLGQSTGDLIEFLRYGVAFHTQFGGCLVHQVDGLIRQEPF